MTPRILVVDDSAAFRRAVREVLAADGLALFACVVDGALALEAVADECPGGALVDVNLPGADGFAVSAQLAAACPALRIVLTSSDAHDVPAEALRECGAVAFVAKVDLVDAGLARLFSGDY